jgi:hypothetical protein
MNSESEPEELLPKERSCGEVKKTIPIFERAAFTPSEFAALFGHEQSWGYRQIYAGKVKVIRGHGRMMIPRGEVERLQQEASLLDG